MVPGVIAGRGEKSMADKSHISQGDGVIVEVVYDNVVQLWRESFYHAGKVEGEKRVPWRAGCALMANVWGNRVTLRGTQFVVGKVFW